MLWDIAIVCGMIKLLGVGQTGKQGRAILAAPALRKGSLDIKTNAVLAEVYGLEAKSLSE